MNIIFNLVLLLHCVHPTVGYKYKVVASDSYSGAGVSNRLSPMFGVHGNTSLLELEAWPPSTEIYLKAVRGPKHIFTVNSVERDASKRTLKKDKVQWFNAGDLAKNHGDEADALKAAINEWATFYEMSFMSKTQQNHVVKHFDRVKALYGEEMGLWVTEHNIAIYAKENFPEMDEDKESAWTTDSIKQEDNQKKLKKLMKYFLAALKDKKDSLGAAFFARVKATLVDNLKLNDDDIYSLDDSQFLTKLDMDTGGRGSMVLRRSDANKVFELHDDYLASEKFRPVFLKVMDAGYTVVNCWVALADVERDPMVFKLADDGSLEMRDMNRLDLVVFKSVLVDHAGSDINNAYEEDDASDELEVSGGIFSFLFKKKAAKKDVKKDDDVPPPPPSLQRRLPDGYQVGGQGPSGGVL